ncbi:MAG: hypothetical protein FJW90_06735 [Actinobacteria bacterium]|nr:hypothetical protein [Actinomycetota bacterium]
MDRIRFVPDDLEPVGGVIVGGFVLHARGKTTGIETEQRAFGVIVMRDGKLFSVAVYPTLESARAAAESVD